MLIAGYSMTGPRPAGRPWTAVEDLQLRELLGSGIRAAAIARKLNRSTGAIYARVNSLKDPPAPARSLPSERATFYHKASSERRRSISYGTAEHASPWGRLKARCSAVRPPGEAAIRMLDLRPRMQRILLKANANEAGNR